MRVCRVQERTSIHTVAHRVPMSSLSRRGKWQLQHTSNYPSLMHMMTLRTEINLFSPAACWECSFSYSVFFGRTLPESRYHGGLMTTVSTLQDFLLSLAKCSLSLPPSTLAHQLSHTERKRCKCLPLSHQHCATDCSILLLLLSDCLYSPCNFGTNHVVPVPAVALGGSTHDREEVWLLGKEVWLEEEAPTQPVAAGRAD